VTGAGAERMAPSVAGSQGTPSLARRGHAVVRSRAPVPGGVDDALEAVPEGRWARTPAGKSACRPAGPDGERDPNRRAPEREDARDSSLQGREMGGKPVCSRAARLSREQNASAPLYRAEQKPASERVYHKDKEAALSATR
jgi:hypothetical protein